MLPTRRQLKSLRCMRRTGCGAAAPMTVGRTILLVRPTRLCAKPARHRGEFRHRSYSVDLALNGVKSRITDLNDPDTAPEDWEESRSPWLGSVNDLSIYELHIRDFSANDMTVPQPHRGTTWPSPTAKLTASNTSKHSPMRVSKPCTSCPAFTSPALMRTRPPGRPLPPQRLPT